VVPTKIDATRHLLYHVAGKEIQIVRRAALTLVVLSLPLILAQGGDPTTPDDPIDPTLRARVERLKAEAGTPTDSPAELAQRLRTLWEWSNAHALAGGVLPLDFPAGVAAANRTLRGGADRAMTLDRVASFIAQMTRELQIKDEQPDAIGPITLSHSGPIVAGEHVTIEETYRVGTMPIQPGGGIMVAQSTRWTGRTPVATELDDPAVPTALQLQSSDPAADNYVSVRSSNPEARFATRERGQEPGLFNVVAFAFFELEGATLRQGDTVTLTFGDRSGGSRGMLVQTWTNDRMLLPIYPDFDGGGQYLTPRWPSLRVVGKPEVRTAQVIARPAVARPGETVELAVRSEDRYRNPSSGRTPPYRVSLNGEPIATLPATDGPIGVVDGIELAEPGVYRFAVASEDGSLIATSNPVWVTEDPRDRIYFGDTHGHSGFADGQGTPDNYYSYARDLSRLDFVTLSEHDIWLDDAEWQTLQEMISKYRDPGRFTPILGYEWTANWQGVGGHHNVYFRTPENRKRVALQEVVNQDELYQGLRRSHATDDVLVVPHAHNPGDWRKSDPDLERLAEVSSGHGTFEWYGNRFLENGFDVGFIGSSDDHTGHPGYIGMTHAQFAGLAAVLAPTNSGEALFDALRARHTYATTGERILLHATLAGAPMGGRVPVSAAGRIRCRAMGTEPIASVDLIKNGEVVYSRNFLAPRIVPTVTVEFSVESSTEVPTYRRPRGPVVWTGGLEVRGATLGGVTRPWFANPVRYRIARDADNANRLRFDANTHGRPKGLMLRLEGASEATEIIVDLEGLSRGRRGRSDTGAATIRLGELLEGPFRHEILTGSNMDAFSLSLVPDDAALDLDFEFTDLSQPQAGDYYYVRVRQVGGGLALGSPWRIVADPE
jgi:hypothetical protein